MHRFFIDRQAIDAQEQVVLDGDIGHQLSRVLRVKAGDMLLLCDGLGMEVQAEVLGIQGGSVEVHLGEWNNALGEPTLRVTIAQALPKADKMDAIIQKATELGAAAFWPIRSARCIVKYDHKKSLQRQRRWQAIAREAAEQSRRGLVPDVKPPVDFNDFITSHAGGFDLVLLCDERHDVLSLEQAISKVKQLARPTKLAVLIGPEGGWTDEESQSAAANGALRIGLGPRILRTETAAIALLAAAMFGVGEWEVNHA